ncbi:MAG: Xaa-Pro peptidase family protein [Desulfovibrio sp.]|nr:Xaa-Pro peptidase family protein [Desulfovibrio sp.]
MNSIFAKRRDRLRERMATKGFDAVLISYAANRYYLSGFELHDVQCNESSGHLVIGADGRDYLITDPRYHEAASSCLPQENVIIYHGGCHAVLADVLRKLGVRIGLEMDVLSRNFVRMLSKKAPLLAFESCDGLTEDLRLFKDATEIEALGKSFALNHNMLHWLENELSPGLPEKAISWKIERYFRENGASELAFPSIVAIDQNAALPHAQPGDRIISESCLILVDVGCRVENYCSDQTRTYWIGKNPEASFSKTLALVREAQEAAIDIMRPGVAFADVYAKAYQVFEREGVASAFTHGLGHGVGLETHERPSLSPRSQGTLKPGMVVTVEPGLYFPTWGGCRWENTVLVEEDGVRIL